jgi:uncharacterized protein with HEPN domain
MSPRDLVYVGHMLDLARKAVRWADIIGMRHKVVHDYLGVDDDIVWQVVVEDLPKLVAALEPIVPPAETP